MPPNCLLWWREKFVATPTYYNPHCHRGNCAIYWVFKFGSTTWKIDERINVWQEERERKKCESGSETEGTWQRAKFLELMMARADNLSANVVCHCWAFAFVVPSSPPASAFPSVPTSFCRCRSEFDGFVRIFRLMLRLLFTVGTVGTVHSGSHAPLICLPCNFSTFPLFARAISQVVYANKCNTFPLFLILISLMLSRC